MPASRAQQAIVSERRTNALRLRVAGLSCQAISDQLDGYKTASAVSQDIARALTQRRELEDSQASMMVTLEAERLDMMERAAWIALRRRHILVSQGRVMRDEDGSPFVDDAPTLQAIQTLLRIQERRAKLFGWDAPSRARIEVTDTVDAEIERLIGELAGLGRPGETSASGAVAGGAGDETVAGGPPVEIAGPPEAAAT